MSQRHPIGICSKAMRRVTQWVSYQIRKIAGCACAGNAGNVFPRHRFQRKPLVSDPGMHHGTCVTHVPWCMSGSLTCGDGENVPGIPGACATHNFTYLARGPWRFGCLIGYLNSFALQRCGNNFQTLKLRRNGHHFPDDMKEWHETINPFKISTLQTLKLLN